MRGRLAFVIGATLIGCVATSRIHVERPKDAGAEYDDGLSRVLELADDSDQADLLRFYFNYGYVTGGLEASSVQLKHDGDMLELGCLGSLAPIVEVLDAMPVDPAWCATLKSKEFANAEMPGPLFARGRLQAVETGLSTSDTGYRTTIIAAFESGYAQSMNVARPKLRDYEKSGEMGAHGCGAATREAAKRASRPDLVSVLTPRCKVVGAEIAEDMRKAPETFAAAVRAAEREQHE